MSNMLLALPSFENMGPVFQKTKAHLSEVLSAFEYFDRQSYDLVCQYVPLILRSSTAQRFMLTTMIVSLIISHTGRKALDDSEVGDSQAFVLIETSGGKREHDESVCGISHSCSVRHSLGLV